MSVSQKLADRLRELFIHGKWIANTNYKALLGEIDFNLAKAKVENCNSIAALTFHINYYLSGILKVFNGGNLDIHDQFSFDYPEIKEEQDWEHLVDSLINSAEQLILVVENLSDTMLEKVFVDLKYGSYQRNIEGVIEHGYYHLGQMVLIKKLKNIK